MSDRGKRFQKAIVRYIDSWNDNIEVLQEEYVGYRWVGTPRKLDIVLRYGGKYLGIEAKLQEGSGSAYQKLSYTLEDCKASPIPTIIVFAGDGINNDMKARLVTSGIGLEVIYFPDDTSPDHDYIEDPHTLLRQRVYIELGLDWFKLFRGR